MYGKYRASNIKGGPAEGRLVQTNYFQVEVAEAWSGAVEPQHLCGKAPFLWGSWQRFRQVTGKVKELQKNPESLMEVWSQEEHWENSPLETRNKEENRGSDQTGLEIPNGKSELIRSYQIQLGVSPLWMYGSWVESGVALTKQTPPYYEAVAFW